MLPELPVQQVRDEQRQDADEHVRADLLVCIMEHGHDADLLAVIQCLELANIMVNLATAWVRQDAFARSMDKYVGSLYFDDPTIQDQLRTNTMSYFSTSENAMAQVLADVAQMVDTYFDASDRSDSIETLKDNLAIRLNGLSMSEFEFDDVSPIVSCFSFDMETYNSVFSSMGEMQNIIQTWETSVPDLSDSLDTILVH